MIDLDIDIVNRLLGSDFAYYTILSKLAPPHIKSVLTAMRDYGIHFIIIPQNKIEITLELDALEVMDAEFVAVISDDTSFSLGPNHFDHEMLKGLVEKSSHAAIISTDASADIYDMLSSIAGTRQTGTLIVETMPEHEMQWAIVFVLCLLTCRFSSARCIRKEWLNTSGRTCVMMLPLPANTLRQSS